MRYAYADPPYPGCAVKYRGVDRPDAEEVDHAALIARLQAEYPDGWALSSHGKGLREVLLLCPPDVRVGVWVNTTAPPQSALRVTPVWEPVFYRGGRSRRRGRGAVGMVNALVAPGSQEATRDRFLGAKPAAFAFWVLGLLGVEAGDTVDDLFPGSGAVGRAADRYVSQCSMSRLWDHRPARLLRDAHRSGKQGALALETVAAS